MFANDSRTGQRKVVFTAQSKQMFYCRDAVCEFVFNQGSVPLNPFRAFSYFLGDRVDRDLVRVANNNLIRITDELWVFGETMANGVLFEVEFARSLGKPVKYFTIHNLASKIHKMDPTKLRFEPEVYKSGLSKEELLDVILGPSRPRPADPIDQLLLFEETTPDGPRLLPTLDVRQVDQVEGHVSTQAL